MYLDLQSALAGDVSEIPEFSPPKFERNISAEDFRAKVELAKD